MPDQNCLVIVCIKNCMKRSILFNRAVTNISGCNLKSSLAEYLHIENIKVSLLAPCTYTNYQLAVKLEN